MSRVFIGPRRRGSLTRKLEARQKIKGRRGPMRFTLAITDQPTLEGDRIEFTATIFHQRVHGVAGTVALCIEQLETIYDERIRPAHGQRTD